MEQILLILSVVAGVVFGFVIAWISLRSERNSIYEKGKADAASERAALEERVSQKELRIQEIYTERAQERAELDRLREQVATGKAAQTDFEERLQINRRQAEEAVAGKLVTQQELITTLRAAAEQKTAELETLRQEAAGLRAAEAAAKTSVAEKDVMLAELRDAQQKLAEVLRAAQADYEQRLKESRQQADELVNAARSAVTERAADLDHARQELASLRATEAAARTSIAERDAMLAELRDSQQKLAEALRAAQADYEQRLREARQQADELINAARGSATERSAELDGLRQELSTMRSEGAALRTAIAEKDTLVGELRDAHNRLTDTFRALAAEALQNNNQTFVELARQELGRLQSEARGGMEVVVKPLQEQLDKMDRNVAQLERSRAESDGRLKEQLASLQTVEQQLRAETANLISALRAPAVRGRWGEVQLRRVVELAGMLQHVDFTEQPSVQTDNGMQRPDMIIHLPSQRQIVVDAKVSLQAYLDALDCQDEPARVAKLTAHAGQVRAHLTRLADKRYWSQFPETPEFVVAFLPAETFFSAALERDPSLIEFGAEQRVILATPTTLIALLKAVAFGWQQQRLADNARTISEIGQQLYDRLRVFTSYVEDMRRNLVRTVDSYNKAAASLETRVLVSARRFRELGAANSDELPLIEPIDSIPRTLQALEQAALEFEEPERVMAAGGTPAALLNGE